MAQVKGSSTTYDPQCVLAQTSLTGKPPASKTRAFKLNCNLQKTGSMVTKVVMPSISFIVARSHPGNVIGCDNTLPWHLKSDLKRFRKITTGHAVIIGKNTFDSIGHPLPNRNNIILSRDATLANDKNLYFHGEKELFWAESRDTALFLADIFSIVAEKEDLFVIGGSQIYKLFYNQVNKVYLTEVFADVEGDSYFTLNFNKSKWKLEYEELSEKTPEDEFDTRFRVYQRRKRYKRYNYVSEFFTDHQSRIT